MLLSQSNDLLPAITEDETVAVLNAIAEKSQLLTQKMAQAAQNIKQQIQAQGQDMEDSKIMTNFILPHYVTQYGEIVGHALSQFDVTEEELQDATTQYLKDGVSEQEDSVEKIRSLVKKIRMYYRACGGEVHDDEDEEGSEGAQELSLEKIIEFLSVLSQVVLKQMDGYIASFKEKYGVPSDQLTQQAFYQGVMSISEE